MAARDTVGGPLWKRMHGRPRIPLRDLVEADTSTKPGVYAFYRSGRPVYVGKAKALSGRLWRNHLSGGSSMTNSAFRRNVAEKLGIASAADIKARRYVTTKDDANEVSKWIAPCHVAWIECATEEAAIRLEVAMKREWMPPLTKR